MSMTIVRERDEFQLHIDGVQVARVAAEVSRTHQRFALHLNTWDEAHRRKGYCSMLFDYASAILALEGYRLTFIDEPAYNRYLGCGMYTANGQAFADAYRRKRGIRLPRFMWRSGVVVHRANPDRPRWKEDEYWLDLDRKYSEAAAA